MDLAKGFDISHWQGVFDFKKAFTDGYRFCFVKATEGESYVDKQFKRNWEEAPKHNIYVGAYHFFRPALDPVLQAQHHLKAVGELGLENLPCVLDWEVTDGVRNSEQTSKAHIWLEYVHEKTGKVPILYTGPSFVQERGGLKDFSAYPLWLAHYAKAPRVPKAWGRYTFWQFSSSGGLDKNLFNGSLESLRRFIGTSQIQTPSPLS